MALSEAAFAANDQLKKLREVLGVKNHPTSQSAQRSTPNYALQNGQKQLKQYRWRDGIKAAKPTRTPLNEPLTLPNKPSTNKREARQARLPLEGKTIKHYPDLGIAALNATEGAIYRVWLLCRHLDKNGRGWLPTKEVRDALTKKGSKLKVFGWRRLRQILAAGEGRYWHRGETRLWLYGVAAVAEHLNVERLKGRPVALPLTVATARIGEFQAHLYGAWHSGRKTENPISRATQRKLLHVPERTQRHYCQVAQIQRTVNYAIGGKHSQENQQESAWEHSGTFPFKDKRGYQGKKNQEYIAWQLPSSHKARHSTAPKGRQRKINRQLTADLVNYAAQGNDGNQIDKRFFKNGAEAAKAYNKQGGGIDSYWPQSHRKKAKQFDIWTYLAK
jgi:hypothetical protein